MQTLRKIVTNADSETFELGRRLANELQEGVPVALSGELGTGKTTLVRGICAYFGGSNQVTSPTFTIINEYSGTKPVSHTDLYRLDSIDEMLGIGLDEVFTADQIILIEWAERAGPILPLPRLEILCAHTMDENRREYTIHVCTKEGQSILPAHTETTSRI
jgi:tRNA threonylcarbamoyladenosine biosynthesis protein TsaE